MDSDGSNGSWLFDARTSAYAPTWSPDGAQLAFESRDGGASNIYHIEIDGSHAVRVLPDDAANGQPAWSP